MTPADDPLSALLATLANPATGLAETMNAVEDIEAGEGAFGAASIGLSAGSTIDLLGLYLRKHALLNGVKLTVRPGNFDDPVGDMERFAAEGLDYALVAPFFDLLMPAFEARAGHLDPALLDAKEAELRDRFRLALGKAAGLRAVYLAEFHRFGPALAGGDAVDAILARFNQALREEAAAFANVRLIDMEAVIAEVGRNAAFDRRFYFRNRAPYSAVLLDEWARRIAAMARGFGGRFHKALVLDCDNTLWGGILGEDLLSGIKLAPHDYPGSIFWRVQQELAGLRREGVLLCLCSKNNPQDVDEALDRHPEMVLRQDDIILKKVNWSDKVANLREIAAELNIGLDSLVLLDDSPFECEAVRAQLPMVQVFQVPADLPRYPEVIGAIKDLLLAGGVSADSRAKTEQYRQRALARAESVAFDSHETYLASLDLTVTVSRNDAAQAVRISELSQKSNQFNLTTRRYGLGEIQALMVDPDAAVYSAHVADKFGAAGLTGVIVMRRQGETAVVENLLMSCRVLGRGVEFALWEPILRDAAAWGCRSFIAEYRPTAKNVQAADFYDRLGLALAEELDGVRRYANPLDGITLPPTPWIKVLHD